MTASIFSLNELLCGSRSLFHREKQFSSNVIIHMNGNSTSIRKVFCHKKKHYTADNSVFIKRGLCIGYCSPPLSEWTNRRTKTRPLFMTSHMIQRTQKDPHSYRKRGYLYSSASQHFASCFCIVV